MDSASQSAATSAPSRDTAVILAGDLNCHNAKWYEFATTDMNGRAVDQFCLERGLEQLVTHFVASSHQILISW